MLIDLASLPPCIRNIVSAAQKVDRVNLDNVRVHPCDHGIDSKHRKGLHDEARSLSDALANAGLTLGHD